MGSYCCFQQSECQATMSSPETDLVRDVVRLFVRAQRKQARCRDGASTVRCHVLTELTRQDDIAQKVLVERLGLDKGWISRAVKGLVAEGVITKRTSELDRRSVVLCLTPAGRVRSIKLENDLNRHSAQLLARIPIDRRVQVRESLTLLLQALSDPVLPDPC